MIFQLLTQLEKESRGQFNKTFTLVIYKCSDCFTVWGQQLHLWITRVKVFIIKLTPGAPNRSRTYELLGTTPNALPVYKPQET